MGLVLNNMDKSRKIEIEVRKMHKKIKKSNLVLRERMQEICEDMKDWNFLGEQSGESNKGYLR